MYQSPVPTLACGNQGIHGSNSMGEIAHLIKEAIANSSVDPARLARCLTRTGSDQVSGAAQYEVPIGCYETAYGP